MCSGGFLAVQPPLFPNGPAQYRIRRPHDRFGKDDVWQRLFVAFCTYLPPCCRSYWRGCTTTLRLGLSLVSSFDATISSHQPSSPTLSLFPHSIRDRFWTDRHFLYLHTGRRGCWSRNHCACHVGPEDCVRSSPHTHRHRQHKILPHSASHEESRSCIREQSKVTQKKAAAVVVGRTRGHVCRAGEEAVYILALP